MDLILSPVPNKIFLWLFSIVVVFPLIIVVALKITLKFDTSILLVIFFFHLIIAIAISAFIKKNTITKQDNKYKINLARLYQIEINEQDLSEKSYEIINLDETPNLLPKLRLNGIGLPGYQAGWFKLRNNQKSFIYLTQRNKVLYIPKTSMKNYSLLISID